MITVVDYGLGNVRAIVNIYNRLGIPVATASTASELADARKLVLPGVGAFDWAMQRLEASGMRGRLDELVVERGSHVLGICVGMQMLGRQSDEGECAGLGWIDASVRLFQGEPGGDGPQLPHMGWNDVAPVHSDCLFRELGGDARFYFLHSYCVVPNRREDILATTEYHGPFASSVRRGNIFGVQFHPEKSHQWGINLLKNYAELS